MTAAPDKSSFVRTVLGDIPASTLGMCYAHEHIVIDRSYATDRFPEFLLNDLDKIVAELQQFQRDGGQAMVDSMPGGSGRNVSKLAEVSRRTGVHIMCPTGLHLEKYYPPDHWSKGRSAEELAEVFVAEIEQGIRDDSYGESSPIQTKHRAGLVKVASGLNEISPRDRRIFEAAAIAHARTGAPILTHTEQGTAALAQIAVLERFGVNLRHVVLSHTDRKPDLAYHREILATCAGVEFDSAFRWKAKPENPTLDLLVALLNEFPEQIMLGMDAARPAYWKTYGGTPGLSFLLTEFSQQMRGRGVDKPQWRRLFIENPAHYFSFDRSRRSH